MKIILILLVLMAQLTAFADTKLSIMGSYLHNVPEADIDGGGIDEKTGAGFGLGLRALMGINDQLHFRSGASIIQRNVDLDIDTPPNDLELSYSYLAVPLTLYWKASPKVGLFGGTAINAKISDKCDASVGDCDLEDGETLVFPAIIGFDFSFTDSLGLEASYEYALTEASEDLKIHSAVISILYHLP